MKLALLSLCALALASAPSSQGVSFRGKVEDVSGTAGQFVVDCTGASLSSATFDLNAFVGTQVQIDGTWNGSASSPSVQVTAIAPVAEIFEIGGGAKIGDTSSLAFTGAPGDLALGLISLGTSFIPFQGTNGVIFLDPGQVVLTRSGLVGGAGNLEIPFAIPNDPTLVGVDIFGQGALLTPGGIVVSNPDCKTIQD